MPRVSTVRSGTTPPCSLRAHEALTRKPRSPQGEPSPHVTGGDARNETCRTDTLTRTQRNPYSPFSSPRGPFSQNSLLTAGDARTELTLSHRHTDEPLFPLLFTEPSLRFSPVSRPARALSLPGPPFCPQRNYRIETILPLREP